MSLVYRFHIHLHRYTYIYGYEFGLYLLLVSVSVWFESWTTYRYRYQFERILEGSIGIGLPYIGKTISVWPYRYLYQYDHIGIGMTISVSVMVWPYLYQYRYRYDHIGRTLRTIITHPAYKAVQHPVYSLLCNITHSMCNPPASQPTTYLGVGGQMTPFFRVLLDWLILGSIAFYFAWKCLKSLYGWLVVVQKVNLEITYGQTEQYL